MRTGWGPEPLTTARALGDRRRYARAPAAGRLRVTLLELPHAGPPIAAQHAWWINRASRRCVATVNGAPERADVVWLLAQDPLGPVVRARLAERLARLPPGVAVLNGPATYDAYHDPDAFARLEAAGVRVPRTRFGPDDVGVTRVVHKRIGEQPATKHLGTWTGPVAGFRSFAFEDGRGADGLIWRHRAYHLLGEVLSGDSVGSPHWEARAEGRAAVDVAPELPAGEREQVALLARTLGLDFFAVDYLRRAGDGAAVFLDVNVFPMVLIAEGVTGAHGLRGGWHVWSVADRIGRPDPGRSHWRRFDEAMDALAGRARRVSR
jgi:hypothetical protein